MSNSTFSIRLAVLAVAAATLLGASVSSATSATLAPTARIYWADPTTDFTQARIQRANPDGTGVQTLQSWPTIESPQWVAVSTNRHELYWTTLRAVQRSSLDGGPPTFIGGAECAMGVALDTARYKVYWADECGNAIRRANLDGSGDEVVLSGLESPRGIAVDSPAGKIYWAETSGHVRRANLDGTGVETLVTRSSFFHGIALDVAAGKMYWGVAGGPILRADLDGSDVEEFVILESGANPIGVAVDAEAGVLYWTDQQRGTIQRASTGAGPIEDVITSGLETPWGIAVENPDPPALPPPNDDIDQAVAVGELPFTDLVNTNGATTAADDPAGCFGGPERTVWYSLTTTRLRRVHIFGERAIDVFTGSRGALNHVGCGVEDIVVDAAPGTTYYVMLSLSVPVDQPELTVTFEDVSPAVPNDEFEGATTIGSLTFNDFVEAGFASSAPDDPSCFGTGSTVWYTFTPEESMRIEAVAFDSSGWDPTLSVHTGERGLLTQVACNDTYYSDGTTHAGVDFAATAGVTYYFMVGSRGSGGALGFFMQRPLEYEITIDGAGKVARKTGIVTLSGTLTCSRPAEGSFDILLRQVFAGRLVAEATRTPDGVQSCSPTPTRWTATFQSDTAVLFGAGKASATVVNDQICDPRGCRATRAPSPGPVTVRLSSS
jgi:DNA-binding beta-propeller fold protein YncE